MGAVVWSLPVLLGLVLPLWEGGPPAGASFSLVVAGVLLKARQVHASHPGHWFPLLVTGSTLFAAALSVRATGPDLLRNGSAAFGLWRFLIGFAVAVGLGIWAWRSRSATVAVTAVGYLAAVWYFLRPEPAEDFGWFAYAPAAGSLPVVPPFDFPPHPELVVVAGAVLAHAVSDRVRPWHVLAIAGLVGSLWHYSALALVVAAVVAGAHDLNARRPGAWYPLLLVGVGLVVWPVVDAATAPRWTDPALQGPPDGYYATLTAVDTSASAVAVSSVDHDELFLAFVVAAGLVVWSWRRRSPVMLLTAVAYLGAAWSLGVPDGIGLVVPGGGGGGPPAPARPRGGGAGGGVGGGNRTIGGGGRVC
ncbi:hypothetical protein AB0G02_32160, partial [Actinosynnema sp. NPDC023658]|uniref:hypothetical protein n=1 Tax=Actinosynnema sp. NPDC023658 TaxID=3155465 RepID=UPI00340DF8BC